MPNVWTRARVMTLDLRREKMQWKMFPTMILIFTGLNGTGTDSSQNLHSSTGTLALGTPGIHHGVSRQEMRTGSPIAGQLETFSNDREKRKVVHEEVSRRRL